MASLKEAAELLADSAAHFAKEYQKKAVDLAKIEATTCYVKGVNLVRRQCLFAGLIAFCLILGAVGAVTLPLALLFYAPWSPGLKMLCVSLLGVSYIAVSAVVLVRFFSESQWMRFSRASELVEQATKKN